MLFNSYAFILLYLPITLAGYWLLVRRSPDLCVDWLSVASVAFYAGWNPRYISLLLTSIVGNYCFSMLIVRARPRGAHSVKTILACAVVSNLALLGYFKYANFFVKILQELAGLEYVIGAVILPLGISFFTFTQIAFLVDLSQGETSTLSFRKYLLFVTFFPHLIAGPILHHASIVPQFSWPKDQRKQDLEVGIAIFIFGLFKKVIIADGLAKFVSPVFDAAAKGQDLAVVESWAGVVAFSLQLYFDFSGYSDMAIGLARMCGVHFPLNFSSPYKAHNIIEFWRRWHMTLSQFLRDYLYIPLGGNRHGPLRRYLNLMITMVLGGLWHGAAWTFVLWGAMHGIYLVLNHAWQFVTRKLGLTGVLRGAGRPIGIFVTFSAVTIAWVFFRASSLPHAVAILRGMTGINGIRLPTQWESRFDQLGVHLNSWVTFADMGATFAGHRQIMLTSLCLAIVWLLPNTQEIMVNFEPGLNTTGKGTGAWWQWRPTPAWALVMAILTLVPMVSLNQVSEFLYYQF